ncbi:rare lipoprotein A [Lysobacter sp. yr284]|uniref:septal ring lytic transglycosylase RlpA family protein n=1 Tax=Lysobacter TaxID=68 RepID=UPI0008975307|nr:septal ring lytic transglycosylase RlpA family protein [Lysobacter sp. yr284]SDY79631.1 rare lipoprotein A [Lysobacter sp. yr284]
MPATALRPAVRLAFVLAALAASASAPAQLLQPQAAAQSGTMAVCSATWYGAEGEIPEGWPTASGEPFHRFALAAAHNSLPFGTNVRVTYQGRSVTVRINDRGGFGWPVCIDLTYGAFLQIAHPDQGVVSVDYQVL